MNSVHHFHAPVVISEDIAHTHARDLFRGEEILPLPPEFPATGSGSADTEKESPREDQHAPLASVNSDQDDLAEEVRKF